MKRIFFLLIAIFIIPTTALICQTKLDKVKELLTQKKSAEAIAACQSYLQSNARDENAWLLLAKAQQQAGDLNAAENAAKKSIDLDDELMEGYTTLSQIQLEKKNWRDAYNTAHAGLKMIPPKEPKYVPLLIELALSLLTGDSADAALITASEAREIDPNNPVAYEIIGKAYLRQNQHVMAVSNFKKSLEIDPQQIRVLFELADAYTKGRQYTEAAETWIEILKRDSTNETARLELATLLFRAKQYAKCVKVLEDYFATHKNPPKEIRKMYIEALLRSGQYDKAFKEAQEIIKSEPNSSLAHRVYANYYFSKKQYTQAIDAFNKLAVVDTLDYDDYRLLGFAYTNAKKDSLAARVWEEIVKDTSQSITIRSYFLGEIGSAWMRIRLYERAADAFQRRIQLDPGSVAAIINYALCLIQMEKFNEALALLEEAKEKNPNYPPIYNHKGYIYFQLKDYEAGKKEYETAMKVADTAEFKYRFELADANRMIGLAIMLRKETDPDPEIAKRKWESSIVYLKRSLKYKEDFAQTHFLLGKCYQNLSKIDDAVREYRRTVKLDPTNKEAKKLMEDLMQYQ
jgi:tetratricopeptide (TPR) repeat protein